MSDRANKKYSKDNFIPQTELIKILFAKLRYRVAKGELSYESYTNIKNSLIAGICNGDAILWGIFCELDKKDKYYELIDRIISGLTEEELKLKRSTTFGMSEDPVLEVLSKPMIIEEKIPENSTDADFDNFISWIRTLLNAAKIGIYGSAQSDIMQVLEILFDVEVSKEGVPKEKEPKTFELLQNFGKVFSFAGLVNKEGLEFLLKETVKKGGIINLGSHNHNIGIQMDKTGKFLAYIRDSNGKCEVTAKDEKELAEKILSCFFKAKAIADESSYFPIQLSIHGDKKKLDYRPMGHILDEMDENGYLKYDEVNANNLVKSKFVVAGKYNYLINSLSFSIKCHSRECMNWYKNKIKENKLANFAFRPLVAALSYGNLFAVKLLSPKNTDELKKELLRKIVDGGYNYLHFTFLNIGGGNVEFFKFLRDEHPLLLKDPEVLFAKNDQGETFVEIAATIGHENLVGEILKTFSSECKDLIKHEDFLQMAFMTLFRSCQEGSNTETFDTVLRNFEEIDKKNPGFMKKILNMKHKVGYVNRSCSLLKFTGLGRQEYIAKKILACIDKYDDLNNHLDEISLVFTDVIRLNNYHFIVAFLKEIESKGVDKLVIIGKIITASAATSKTLDIFKFLVKEVGDTPLAIALAIKGTKITKFTKFSKVYNSMKGHLDDKEQEKILISNIIKLCLKDDDTNLLDRVLTAVNAGDIKIWDFEEALVNLSVAELTKFINTPTVISQPGKIRRAIEEALDKKAKLNFVGVTNKEGLKYLLQQFAGKGSLAIASHNYHVEVNGMVVTDVKGELEFECQSDEHLVEMILSRFFKTPVTGFFPLNFKVLGDQEVEESIGSVLSEMDEHGYLSYSEIDCNQIAKDSLREPEPDNMCSPLGLAIKNHNHKCLNFYRNKEKPTTNNFRGFNPLQIALLSGNRFAFKFLAPKSKEKLNELLLHKPDGKDNLLHHFKDAKFLKVLKEILPQEFLQNALLYIKNEDGLTLMEVAIVNNDTELVEEFLNLIPNDIDVEDEKIIKSLQLIIHRAIKETDGDYANFFTVNSNKTIVNKILDKCKYIAHERPKILEEILKFQHQGNSFIELLIKNKNRNMESIGRLIDWIRMNGKLKEHVDLSLLPAIECAIKYKKFNYYAKEILCCMLKCKSELEGKLEEMWWQTMELAIRNKEVNLPSIKKASYFGIEGSNEMIVAWLCKRLHQNGSLDNFSVVSSILKKFPKSYGIMFISYAIGGDNELKGDNELMKKLWNHIDDNLSEEKFEEIITCLIKDNKEKLLEALKIYEDKGFKFRDRKKDKIIKSIMNKKVKVNTDKVVKIDTAANVENFGYNKSITSKFTDGKKSDKGRKEEGLVGKTGNKPE